MEADFEDDILENEWAFKKSPNENERWNFSQTESVLTLKISGQELLSI